jgi:hypothetical protein
MISRGGRLIDERLGILVDHGLGQARLLSSGGDRWFKRDGDVPDTRHRRVAFGSAAPVGGKSRGAVEVRARGQQGSVALARR